MGSSRLRLLPADAFDRNVGGLALQPRGLNDGDDEVQQPGRGLVLTRIIIVEMYA